MLTTLKLYWFPDMIHWLFKSFSQNEIGKALIPRMVQ